MAWRYFATRLNGDGSEDSIHPELPLREVTITQHRNAPDEISAQINPEYLDLLDQAGENLLVKWSTGIYAEADGEIYAGGIFVDNSIEGSALSLDVVGMAAYPNGQPYTEGDTWPANPPPDELDPELNEDEFEDREVDVRVPYTKKTYNKKTKTTTVVSGWKTVKQVQKVQVKWASELAAPTTTAYPVDGIEPMYVIREIWRHLQAQPGGNLGLAIDQMVTGKRIGKVVAIPDIDPGFDTANGTLELESGAFTLSWFKDFDLGEVVNRLTENLPLEFREEHRWDETRTVISHFLRFGHPGLGQRRTDVQFVVGQNVLPVAIDPPADEYASHVLGLGAGEGRLMPRADVSRSGEGRLRRAVVLEDKSARTAAAINVSAQNELAARIGVDEVASIVVRPEAVQDLRHLMPGDTVPLVVEQPHRPEETMWVRIESKTTSPETDGLEFSVQRADRLA